MRTKQQNENLAKLAKYLLALPKNYDRFDMSDFYRGHEVTDATSGKEVECGSVACAIGHGPAAGIGCVVSTNWVEYLNLNLTSDNNEYDWLFSEEWFKIDNTAKGAAIRVAALLTFRWHIVFSEVIQAMAGNSINPTIKNMYAKMIVNLDVSILDRPEDWV